MWDAHGNLVGKGTGAPPPRSVRGMSTPEEVAHFIHQGLSNRAIAELKGVSIETVKSWKKRWRGPIQEARQRLIDADQATSE
jgi:hypothetical protein